jgi:transposase InsO family protein
MPAAVSSSFAFFQFKGDFNVTAGRRNFRGSSPPGLMQKQQSKEYIEIFYNRQRRHSRLGYVSPAQFAENISKTTLAA